MIVVTKQALIATIAERWLDTHYGRSRWIHATATFDPERIYLGLRTLPANASEADVLAITGQPWWTQNLCAECGNDSTVTVGFGAEPHHALDARFVCLACLEQGVQLARQAGNG
jgi:hypothetical protein